jgi:UDP-glucose 4-epimerase
VEKKIKSIKHYLVIKSTGFKRSHLTKKLIKSGHHVTLLDNLLTGKIQNLSSVINYPKLEVIIGNLLDRTLIKTLIRNIDKGYYLVSVFSIKIITVQVIKKNGRTLDY